METLTTSGRYLFAVSIIAFGIEHFAFGHSLSALILLPDAISAHSFWVYAMGIVFLGAGICIGAGIKVRLVATFLGILFFALYLIFHLPKEITNPKDPGAWTAAFELIGFCGGAFILARTQPGENWDKTSDNLLRSGIYLFASTFIVIGIQHMMYADFIAPLIPSWIPGQLFWAYFIGIAFFAVALSLILGIKVRLATTLLGIMFLSWVLILHGPRVTSNLHTETEWTSLFVALAMSGISFVIAGASPQLFKKSSKEIMSGSS